jgi:hypothetical protein
MLVANTGKESVIDPPILSNLPGPCLRLSKLLAFMVAGCECYGFVKGTSGNVENTFF